MAKTVHQKEKLLILNKIFTEETYTDDNGKPVGLTMDRILDRLLEHGIRADRRTIYEDIEILNKYGNGVSIEKKKRGRRVIYYKDSYPYDFEITELKIISNAISFSKFISKSKTEEIIRKLKKMVSKYEQKELDVHVEGRVKASSLQTTLVINTINSAISRNKKISFSYKQWTPEGNLEVKKKTYVVSPWFIVIDNENCYLVGEEDGSEYCPKNYRVDKIISCNVLEKSKRVLSDKYNNYNIGIYTNSIFNMFSSSKIETVTVRVKNNLTGVFYDKFGSGIEKEVGEETTILKFDVQPSPQFFGWLFGLGNDVKIIEPESIVNEYKSELKKIISTFD